MVLVLDFLDDTIDPVALFVTVEAVLVAHPGEDHRAGCEADGEAEDVDGGVDFVAKQVSEGDEKLISEHEGLQPLCATGSAR